MNLPAIVTLSQTGSSPQSAPASAPVEVVGVPGGTPPSSTGTASPGAPGASIVSGPPAPVPPAGGLGQMTLPLLVLVGVMGMFWLMSSSQRKEQKKLEQLRKELARNDKVQTSGGIVGTIVELGEQDVVLRVDETTNTRIRFIRSAIIHVMNKSGAASSATAEAKPASPVKA